MTQSIFYLSKPETSIFLQHEFAEYPDIELLSGSITKKMGMKISKGPAKFYGEELVLYKNYLKKIKYCNDVPYIPVRYTLPSQGWGRIQADRSLPLSLFHRPSLDRPCRL